MGGRVHKEAGECRFCSRDGKEGKGQETVELKVLKYCECVIGKVRESLPHMRNDERMALAVEVEQILERYSR